MQSLSSHFDKDKQDTVFTVRNLAPDNVVFEGNETSLQANGVFFDTKFEAMRPVTDAIIEAGSSIITVEDERGFHYILGENRK